MTIPSKKQNLAGVPFANHCTASKPARNNKHRLKIFRRFIGWDKVPDGLSVLDIGASNYIGRELGITHFTAGDLNRTLRTTKYGVEEYDVITCFEVINHLFNHGVLIENIKKRLKKGGTLYLSTPLYWLVAWKHGRGNYVEMTKESIQKLFEYYGFTVIRYETHNPWFWWFMFWGWRPFWRTLFNRFQLWEMRLS